MSQSRSGVTGSQWHCLRCLVYAIFAVSLISNHSFPSVRWSWFPLRNYGFSSGNYATQVYWWIVFGYFFIGFSFQSSSSRCHFTTVILVFSFLIRTKLSIFVTRNIYNVGICDTVSYVTAARGAWSSSARRAPLPQSPSPWLPRAADATCTTRRWSK